jgi:hypothetical protein
LKPDLSIAQYQINHKEYFNKISISECLLNIKKIKQVKEKVMIILILDDYNRILELNDNDIDSKENKGINNFT